MQTDAAITAAGFSLNRFYRVRQPAMFVTKGLIIESPPKYRRVDGEPRGRGDNIIQFINPRGIPKVRLAVQYRYSNRHYRNTNNNCTSRLIDFAARQYVIISIIIAIIRSTCLENIALICPCLYTQSF